MNILTLDLENNQPSGSIIQVGYCIGNLESGAILDTGSHLVRLPFPELLADRIVDLCGIRPMDLFTGGIDLMDAYQIMAQKHREYECLMNPVTWGGGDSETLRKQLAMENDSWLFGRRWFDTKTLFVTRQLALGLPYQGGLARSMTKVGLKFEGRKHDARDDAINTWRMFMALVGEMRK